jgi:ketosteroid isomerase-like protein
MSGIERRVLDALADTSSEVPDGLFAPGAITWHSFDEVEAPTVPDTFATLRAIREKVPDFTMTDVRTGEGFAQYVLAGTLPDGSALRAPAAMAIHVEGGLVTRIEEYVDTAQLARLFALLG